MKELLYEKRGRASDRLKTEEELAREEKERLEKLEVRLAVNTCLFYSCIYAALVCTLYVYIHVYVCTMRSMSYGYMSVFTCRLTDSDG